MANNFACFVENLKKKMKILKEKKEFYLIVK